MAKKEYVGVVAYSTKSDLAALKGAGVRFLDDRARRVQGRLVREVRLSEEEFEGIYPLWGSIQWSLIPIRVDNEG